MDRYADRDFMQQAAAESKEALQKSFEQAGPLLSVRQEMQIEDILTKECLMKPAAVADTLDTIKHCAGLPDVHTAHIIQEALSGHVSNPKFLAIKTKEISALVDTAVSERAQRMAASKLGAAPVKSAVAPVVSPRNKTP